MVWYGKVWYGMVGYGMVWAGSKTCSLRLLTRPTQPQPYAAIHSSINSTVKRPTRDKTYKNMSIKEENYIKEYWKKKQTVGEANTSEEQAKFLVKKQRNPIQTKSHEQRNKKQENAIHKCTICHKAFTRKGRRDSHMNQQPTPSCGCTPPTTTRAGRTCPTG